ncbi:MAG: hypothetical protein H6667_00660 [Ardenticatenaceae bacterium]|nr:hypothetical protein [Ardenticatenaceae bacterium]
MSFTVFVDDNFHYLDESERYELGRFPKLAAAISAAQRLVNDYLITAYRPGMTAETLFQNYMSFGEDPFIITANGEKVDFSAQTYARQRCEEMCIST